MPRILDESVLTLSQAARALPKLGTRHVSPVSVWRWCRKGIKGVHLEHARIGRRIVTSREALTRFTDALAAADRPPKRDAPVTYSAHQREVERRCRELGI
jgi:hypothetical protein